ncbi:cellulose synthase operon protein YhjQ/BcsQ [Leeia aquatica]|uniref:MinD/ParA family protein n=1 Tax=Leeia aquatica TaxID=2725557 RepID=A0A847SI48_9NEIS|nr:cellulose synthase operon protein YhjQ/BcsQ [Leeia aquatica]NLR76839.1 MinD/ParA family protein [Leeia aquatica]
MAEARWRQDQATGLRQLMQARSQRSISLIGGRGRIGKTSLVINLATSLVHRGNRVLVIDEFNSSGNVAARLGMRARQRLGDVLRGDAPLESLVLDAATDLQILPLSVQPSQLARLDADSEARFAQQFADLLADVDFLLVDAAPIHSPDQPSMALATDERLIVLADRAEAITDAYTFIKLLSRDFAKRDFLLLVNRAPDYTAAKQLFERVARVARRHTQADVRLLGFVPEDETLHRANHLLQPLMPAFADAEASHACLQLAEVLERLVPVSLTPPDAFVHRWIECNRAFLPSQQP